MKRRRPAPPTRRGSRFERERERHPGRRQRHRTRWGTTINAVRDFRDRSGPFAARARSHLTAAAGTDALKRGKEAAIPAPRQNRKSFYNNGLRAGGEGGIRTLGTPQGVQRFSMCVGSHPTPC
jgi:hypothetical protein